MLAAEPADRRAAAAGLAFVARLVGVVEIRAACALKQIARGRRLVAQLARGAREQRARQHAVVAPHARIGGQIGVAHQRADAQPPSGVVSILSSARPFTSMRCVGVSIWSFIRSSRLVPPAMNLAPGIRAAAAAASAGESRALVGEGLHALPPGDLGDRLDDVGIGAAAADVAAHALAELAR